MLARLPQVSTDFGITPNVLAQTEIIRDGRKSDAISIDSVPGITDILNGECPTHNLHLVEYASIALPKRIGEHRF
jgi:hypothetical protein